MASPNQQLEAALTQFANQPGVTPDQAAQLRATATGSAQQLHELNQQAQVGQLKGFALQSATNSTPNLAGTYDIQSSVVTLPTSSFQPSGTTASVDLKAIVKVQQMSVEFAHKTYFDAANNSQPVSQNMVDNLQSTINQSPLLAEQIKKGATEVDTTDRHRRTHLEHFDLIAPGFAAGGTYNGGDKTMRLPALDLQTKTTANQQGRFDADDMTFVLGHEIQHGFNHSAKQQALQTFFTDTGNIAKSAQPIHDYTAPISNYIQAGRDDEAKAEIAGWNALMSRHKQIQPLAPELDLMLMTGNGRVKDFIEQDPTVTTTVKARPLSGLTFNQDGTPSMSAGNITAMGQHYFNKPDHAHAQPGQRSLGIGEKGTSDYSNYYGTFAVEQTIGLERRFAQPVNGVMPQMTINMAAARLSEELLEKEGINLGANKTPQPYYDSSQTPAAPHRFDHTQDGSVNVAHDHQYVPVAPSSPSQRKGPDEPDHPDHAMLEQIRAGVRKVDDGLGKSYDDMSERIARGLLVTCKDNREMYPEAADYSLSANALNRVDHVILAKNGNIFAIEGNPNDLGDPANKRAFASVEQLAHTPIEQSDEKLQVANQDLAQARELTQQQELTRQKEINESAPRMSMAITMSGPGDGGGGGDG
jgi:hypothetical protein